MDRNGAKPAPGSEPQRNLRILSEALQALKVESSDVQPLQALISSGALSEHFVDILVVALHAYAFPALGGRRRSSTDDIPSFELSEFLSHQAEPKRLSHIDEQQSTEPQTPPLVPRHPPAKEFTGIPSKGGTKDNGSKWKQYQNAVAVTAKAALERERVAQREGSSEESASDGKGGPDASIPRHLTRKYEDAATSYAITMREALDLLVAGLDQYCKGNYLGCKQSLVRAAFTFPKSVPKSVVQGLPAVRPLLVEYPGWFTGSDSIDVMINAGASRIWLHMTIIARVLGMVGAYSDSYNVFSQILWALPTHREALLAVGLRRLVSGEVEEAEGPLAKACALLPRCSYVHLLLAFTLFMLDRAEEAVSVLRSFYLVAAKSARRPTRSNATDVRRGSSELRSPVNSEDGSPLYSPTSIDDTESLPPSPKKQLGFNSTDSVVSIITIGDASPSTSVRASRPVRRPRRATEVDRPVSRPVKPDYRSRSRSRSRPRSSARTRLSISESLQAPKSPSPTSPVPHTNDVVPTPVARIERLQARQPSPEHLASVAEYGRTGMTGSGGALPSYARMAARGVRRPALSRSASETSDASAAAGAGSFRPLASMPRLPPPRPLVSTPLRVSTAAADAATAATPPVLSDTSRGTSCRHTALLTPNAAPTLGPKPRAPPLTHGLSPATTGHGTPLSQGLPLTPIARSGGQALRSAGYGYLMEVVAEEAAAGGDVCVQHHDRHDGTEFRLLLAQGFLYLGLLDKANLHFQMVAQDRGVRATKGPLHVLGLCYALVCAAARRDFPLSMNLFGRVASTLAAATPEWSPFHEFAVWSCLRMLQYFAATEYNHAVLELLVGMLGLPMTSQLVREFFGIQPQWEWGIRLSGSTTATPNNQQRRSDGSHDDRGSDSDSGRDSDDNSVSSTGSKGDVESKTEPDTHERGPMETAAGTAASRVYASLDQAPDKVCDGVRAQLLEVLAVALLFSHGNAAAGASRPDTQFLAAEAVFAVLMAGVTLRKRNAVSRATARGTIATDAHADADLGTLRFKDHYLEENLQSLSKKRPLRADPVPDVLLVHETGIPLKWEQHPAAHVKRIASAAGAGARPTSTAPNPVGRGKVLAILLLDMLQQCPPIDPPASPVPPAAEEPSDRDPPVQLPRLAGTLEARWVSLPRARIPVALWLLGHLALIQRSNRKSRDTTAAEAAAAPGTGSSRPPLPRDASAMSSDAAAALRITAVPPSLLKAPRPSEVSSPSIDAALSDGWVGAPAPPHVGEGRKSASTTKAAGPGRRDGASPTSLAASLQKAFPSLFSIRTPVAFPHLVEYFVDTFASCWDELAKDVVIDSIQHIYFPLVVKSRA